ncbi:MAG TPA: winged helix-turn-helix domain-containing protein [Termitinemataceae bacterium]|nr:winged helix-turn-helix domain-containing protein [Termitinemataceae bacterium]
MSAGSEKTLYLFRVSPVIEEWIRRRKGPYRVCRWLPAEDTEGKSSFVKDCLFLVPFEEMGSFQKVHLSVPFITFGKVEYISRAFKAGAVEHLSFPFNPKEFDSRLAHAFNELEKLQKEPPSHSPVWLDRCFLIGPAGKVYLNPFEVMIMTHFLHSPSQVLVRGHVHKELSDGRYRQNRIVDVYISRLRKKIALVCLSQGQVTIRSVRGTGYQLEYQEPRAEEKL